MGTLGRNTYARCQNCGADYVVEAEEESYDEEGADLDTDVLTDWF